jgi:hypothetical protein
MAVRLLLRTGGVVDLRTTACLMSFVIMPSSWSGSITRTFGPTLAAEKLGERHDVRLSRETLRGWMRYAGIWLPRSERKRIQQPRLRREHVGELIQIDGSDHRWFGDRAAPRTLLLFIDDAA